MILGGLQKTTLIDFPGRVACTVFVSGCNFRCPFCYSPELVLPEKIKSQPQISEKEFFDFLEERKGLLEAMVVCGGEPTFNKDLPDFLGRIKKIGPPAGGFLVKLDTNGSNPEMLKKMIGEKLVDYVAMDIKAPLGLKSQIPSTKSQTSSKYKIQNTKYDIATGGKRDLAPIKKSIEIIKKSGIDYEFRTTVVPDLHSKEDILQIARDISPARAYYLQTFRPEKNLDPECERIKPYPQEFLLELQKAVSPFFETCRVR